MPELSSLFEEAAGRVGIDGSPASVKRLAIHLDIGPPLTLGALYKRAKEGLCRESQESLQKISNPIERALIRGWITFGFLSSASAERLFIMSVKHLVPSWGADIPKSNVDPITNIVNRELGPATMDVVDISGPNCSETGYGRVIEDRISKMMAHGPSDNSDCDMDHMVPPKDSSTESWDLGYVEIYDLWYPAIVSGILPKARCQHGCAILEDKMYIFGGKNCRGYLNDLQALDLKSFTWSKIKTRPMPAVTAPHSLIVWNNKLLSVTGLEKDNASTISVSEFDTESRTWRCMDTYGSPPSCRRGQSVTLVGEKLIIYGGEDSNKTCPLENLNLLNLNTLKWDDCVDIRQDLSSSPSPRSFHIATCYLNRYLFIFGGKCGHEFSNDMHILDLQKRQWSRPDVQGENPGPRASHSGVAIGEHWFIAGGSVGTNEVPETLLFNMEKHRWSVVTNKVNTTSPLANEGLSLVSVVYKGEDFLVSFGGYKSRYCNKVNVLKPGHKTDPKLSHTAYLDALLMKKRQLYNTDNIDEKKLLSDAALEQWMTTAWYHRPLKFLDPSIKFSEGEASAETKHTVDMKPSQDTGILVRQEKIDEPGKRSIELGEDWRASTSTGTVCLSALRSAFENPTAKDLSTRAPNSVLRGPVQLDSKSAAVSELHDLYESMTISSVPKLAKVITGANETNDKGIPAVMRSYKGGCKGSL